MWGKEIEKEKWRRRKKEKGKKEEKFDGSKRASHIRQGTRNTENSTFDYVCNTASYCTESREYMQIEPTFVMMRTDATWYRIFAHHRRKRLGRGSQQCRYEWVAEV